MTLGGHHYFRLAKRLGVALISLVSTTGCGTISTDPAAVRPLAGKCSRLASANPENTMLIALEWGGGTSGIYPAEILDGIDLSAFNLQEGGTLADRSELFEQRLTDQINQIYCDWQQINVLVLNGNDVNFYNADTKVLLTQAVRPDGRMDIGEAEYDPCDVQRDNDAVIFGERIRQLAGTYTFDEWVNVFANVTAHEIAHTLGYAHISRENRPDGPGAPYVELMLDRHTMKEMRREHRFVAPQTNCPNETSAFLSAGTTRDTDVSFSFGR